MQNLRSRSKNGNAANGGRQTPKKGHTLRRSKYWFPTAEKMVLIRARTLEGAADIFRKYHGNLDEVNLQKVRVEEVVYDDLLDKMESLRSKNQHLYED